MSLADWYHTHVGSLRRRLRYAAALGRIDLVERLVKKHAWPLDGVLIERHKDYPSLRGGHTGHQLLHIAALHGELDLVEWLIAQGAPLDATTHWGRTVMHLAALGGEAPTVAYLATKGLDPQYNMPSLSTFVLDWDDSGPNSAELIEQKTGKAYRGDEHAAYMAQKLRGALQESLDDAPTPSLTRRARL